MCAVGLKYLSARERTADAAPPRPTILSDYVDRRRRLHGDCSSSGSDCGSEWFEGFSVGSGELAGSVAATDAAGCLTTLFSGIDRAGGTVARGVLQLGDVEKESEGLSDYFARSHVFGKGASFDSGSQLGVDAYGHHFGGSGTHRGTTTTPGLELLGVVVLRGDVVGDRVEIFIAQRST
jgi:hypothetical protein